MVFHGYLSKVLFGELEKTSTAILDIVRGAFSIFV